MKIENPITVIKEKIEEHTNNKEMEAEVNYWNDVFNNLENYDGTAASQKEVRTVEK